MFEGAIDFIKTLTIPTGELNVKSKRKTGFLGLIIDKKSVLALYGHLVEDTQIFKFCAFKDHLEL